MTLEEHAQRLARHVGLPVDAAQKALQAISRLRPVTSGLVDELIELGDDAADGIHDPDLGRLVTFLEMAAELAVRQATRGRGEFAEAKLGT